MSGPAAIVIRLTRPVRAELDAIVRAGTSAQRDVMRARVVLLAAGDLSNADIARRVGVTEKTVRKWRARFAAGPRSASLDDERRSGRPPTVQPFVRFELMKLACSRPPGSKAAFRDTWTLASLRAATRKATGVVVSLTEIRRSLAAASIKPHKMRLWLHSPDPDFRPKVRRICALYLQPPAGATVVCVDEKTGMQALQRKHPTRWPSRGRAGRREFEYIRRGTRTLIAAFNPHDGQVFGRVTRRRRLTDLVAFMEDLARRYPTGRVYVVWDNLNIHCGKAWRAFNARHGGRFRFVHTPLHASWVNQVEIWFSILQRRVLRYGSFVDAPHLSRAVAGFSSIRSWGSWRRITAVCSAPVPSAAPASVDLR
ncbi:MAG: IS630 family transposase [Myxococcales bacterium]|nr:IS630 family transposase [Myxococcales bacterium]